jgi:hypothetical protein
MSANSAPRMDLVDEYRFVVHPLRLRLDVGHSPANRGFLVWRSLTGLLTGLGNVLQSQPRLSAGSRIRCCFPVRASDRAPAAKPTGLGCRWSRA